MKEKRMYPRFECPSGKFCSLIDEKTSEAWGNVRDISRKGIGIIAKSPLEEGKKIDVTINYADIVRQIPSTLKIIWSKPGQILYNHGAEILSISQEDKSELLDHFYEAWKKKNIDKT